MISICAWNVYAWTQLKQQTNTSTRRIKLINYFSKQTKMSAAYRWFSEHLMHPQLKKDCWQKLIIISHNSWQQKLGGWLNWKWQCFFSILISFSLITKWQCCALIILSIAYCIQGRQSIFWIGGANLCIVKAQWAPKARAYLEGSWGILPGKFWHLQLLKSPEMPLFLLIHLKHIIIWYDVHSMWQKLKYP